MIVKSATEHHYTAFEGLSPALRRSGKARKELEEKNKYNVKFSGLASISGIRFNNSKQQMTVKSLVRLGKASFRMVTSSFNCKFETVF